MIAHRPFQRNGVLSCERNYGLFVERNELVKELMHFFIAETVIKEHHIPWLFSLRECASVSLTAIQWALDSNIAILLQSLCICRQSWDKRLGGQSDHNGWQAVSSLAYHSHQRRRQSGGRTPVWSDNLPHCRDIPSPCRRKSWSQVWSDSWHKPHNFLTENKI